jgi:hypothetical protein
MEGFRFLCGTPLRSVPHLPAHLPEGGLPLLPQAGPAATAWSVLSLGREEGTRVSSRGRREIYPANEFAATDGTKSSSEDFVLHPVLFRVRSSVPVSARKPAEAGFVLFAAANSFAG